MTETVVQLNGVIPVEVDELVFADGGATVFDQPQTTSFLITDVGTDPIEYAKGLTSGSGDQRLCTVTSSFSNQPTIVPITMQRGAGTDCVYFRIKQN
ncbi:hypothetical protein FKR81_40670 [Lentzea tibetensis]|uniref:Uncharacterized protein n=1 Tax=Lentzea tibetensis TaxID=2591470 RepID=A0A563EFR7_9PSEU|nr:hypothetical protein [Lentzea tibetensis]TWP44778.1 hypothetical protein FKR81_40670 [Lentzea tibetensis]